MPDRTLSEQLTKYLTDVHSIEVQALAQMKAAPDIAGDERLAAEQYNCEPTTDPVPAKM